MASSGLPAPPPLPWERLRERALEVLDPEEGRWLLLAVELGREGWGRVHPNPMVGCVLVRDGKAVGEGRHRRFGGPHAEVEALAAAGDEARGATAYVSLEPCAHEGKTPPCARALEEAGVARVVYGAQDPSRDAGGGAGALEGKGVLVSGPVFPPELARSLDPAFFHGLRGSHRPYVAAKLALSLDARIAARPGERTSVSGPEAEAYTHRLRGGFQGVMVGSGTVAADDPRLTVRGGGEPRVPPARLVLDTEARNLGPGSALLRGLPEAPVHLFCAENVPGARTRALEAAGVRVHRLPRSEGGVELDAVLRVSWDEGIRAVLCEGGGRLVGSLLARGVVSRLFLYLAPRLLGEEGVPGFPGSVAGGLAGEWMPLGPTRLLGRDVLIVYDRLEDGQGG